MADWNEPTTATASDTVITDFKARDVDSATMFVSAPTNPPTDAIRWNRATHIFEAWSGAAWVDIDVATGLGLGTMSLQNSNAVNITGGTIAGCAIAATELTSGLIPLARLTTTGSAVAGNALGGDQAWHSYPPIGTGGLWFTATPPTGWLILNGQAVSRATYADLFTLWGTTYGVGDGATTFNVPDMRGTFPFGKAVAGTGSTLGGTFGAIDHTHTGPSHTHSVPGLSVPALSLPTSLGATDFTADDSHIHGGVAAGSDLTAGPSASHTHPFTATIGGNTGTGTTGTGTSGSGGTGATGTANPPGFAIHFIVKAL